jgi:methylenetetrahydrofolate dehydrogenase (NADP+) / methenyltetrahydrofolate cyclohydrolase
VASPRRLIPLPLSDSEKCPENRNSNRVTYEKLEIDLTHTKQSLGLVSNRGNCQSSCPNLHFRTLARRQFQASLAIEALLFDWIATHVITLLLSTPHCRNNFFRSRQGCAPIPYAMMECNPDLSQFDPEGAILTARILNGTVIRDQIYAELAQEIAELQSLGIRPGLAAVLVGDNPASKIYVRSKIAACQQLGLGNVHLTPPANTTTAELLTIVHELNTRDDVDGILVQLPLPPQIDAKKILEAVDPAKDVDGFHPVNIGKLVEERPSMVACTPLGVMQILHRSGIRVEGADAVVVGRSNIVGKPMALLLMHADATVTVCHSKTRDLRKFTRQADILIAAAGHPALIVPDDVNPGATVIDVGTTRITDPRQAEKIFAHDPERLEKFHKNGSAVVGDVHPDVAQVAGAITPVPGGVGPLTIAMLMSNTVKAARLRRGSRAPETVAAR